MPGVCGGGRGGGSQITTDVLSPSCWGASFVLSTDLNHRDRERIRVEEAVSIPCLLFGCRIICSSRFEDVGQIYRYCILVFMSKEEWEISLDSADFENEIIITSDSVGCSCKVIRMLGLTKG